MTKKKCGILFSTMNNFVYSNYFCQDKKNDGKLFLNKETEKKSTKKKNHSNK